MSNISNNYDDIKPEPELRQLVVNTADFNDQDLQDFVDISEEIVRCTRERRSLRKRSKSRSNTIEATMTREGLFESIFMDDDQFLKALEHETVYDMEEERAALLKSIENLMKYFDEDVKIREDSFFKSALAKKSTRGKVATAVASLRNKCGLATSSSVKRQTATKIFKSANIQELKKKYENCYETNSTTSAKAKDSGAKGPKLKRKTKVKQLALLFNNINSMIRNSSPTAQTADAATLKNKTPKLKSKFPTYKTKLQSPKPSPFLKRKSLPKAASNSSLSDSPILNSNIKNQLVKPPRAASVGAENVFSQLNVKDKVLLYNKFIEDMTKRQTKFNKPKAELVFEKQKSVQYLRACLEAKLSPGKTLSMTLPHTKKSSCKSPVITSSKSKEYEDILPASRLDADAQHLSSPESTLTVVLKSTTAAESSVGQAKKPSKKKDVTFAEKVTILEHPTKRTQSMIRSTYCVEPLAPPKKIRRFHQERLEPKMFFQDAELEELFYYWLKDKNGVAFDIMSTSNKSNLTEIETQHSSGPVVGQHGEQEIIKDEQFGAEDNMNKGISIIKNTLENEGCLEKSVIEIELPLEDEQQDAPTNPIRESDSGLTSTNKATSEDSQVELDTAEAPGAMAKPLRKKKLRRNYTFKTTVASTDSDSDYKAKSVKIHSSTLPRTTKPSSYIQNMMPKPCETSKSEKLHSQQHNIEKDTAGLDDSLSRQLNSSSDIRNAYTLTVLSSPSPQLESDFYCFETASTLNKGVSRSCPSLLETSLDSNIAFLRDKSASEELTEFVEPTLLQQQQTLLMDSLIDQGFNMDGSDTQSHKRADIKANSDIFTWPQQEPAVAAQQDNFISNDCTPQKAGRNTALNSFNESSFSTPNSTQNRLNVNQKLATSQFWISLGDFSAAITIHYYEPECLKLLHNLYIQKSLETREKHFGIDDQRFELEGSATLDEIINKVPQIDNCSQYWFATSTFLIPFRGPQMTNDKIHKFFNYIRAFMENTDTLRFGIDDYDFANSYQQQTPTLVTPINDSTWAQIISSPLKTSDLDQSDMDSEEYEQNLAISATTTTSSLEEIWRKFAANEQRKFTAEQTVKTLQHQTAKLRMFDEQPANGENFAEPGVTNNNESFRSVMHAIENVGRAMATTTAI